MQQALKKWRVPAVIALFLAAGPLASHSKDRDARLVPVSRAKLCVTKGAVEATDGSQLEVKVPEMRAVLMYSTKQAVEAKVTYLGPTATEKRLGSGELRRQFGLKLRAQNGCNLVYAMWRIEPKSELAVSYKRNPGMSTHAECGTHGYHNIKPTRDLKAPTLKKGEKHTLHAAMEGDKMQVFIDGKLTWEGMLHEALAFDGPVGVRTDNGRFKFELFAGEPASENKTACHATEEDE